MSSHKLLLCPFCKNHNGFQMNTPMSVMGQDSKGILECFCSRCLDPKDGSIGSYRYTKDGKTVYMNKAEVP